MGRSFESEELDRPDLNKCPDCGCLFASSNCPLCGKVCPEEWRAGNRKPVKKRKKSRGSSGRVVFVEWYHSWWFILIMLFVMPIMGIILLATSPHKKSIKIGVIAAAVVWAIISYVGVGNIISGITNTITEPVDTSMSQEEYISACHDITAEEFYRNTDKYTGEFVTLTLTVTERVIDTAGYYDGIEYNTYYVCKTEGENGEFEILIRDCVKDGSQKYLKGDVINIYGEGAGEVTIYSNIDYMPITAPCINVAHIMF